MKIGYTTGVFDLFHIGHLNILKKAKSQCDFLIVAVTTDDEVYRVKGKYPIIPFEERLEIVKSIVYVNKAVPEHDVDKMKAWHKYNYDVIIKGSDWQNSKVFLDLKPKFDTIGVEVTFFEYTAGTSSTQLRLVLDSILDK